MSSDLNFLFEGETVPFRGVRRKGELRYIASNQRGSLAAITRFAPPTKRLPKLVLRIGSLVNFRIPGFSEPIEISLQFLNEVSDRLKIPVARIGMYVGEPNDRRKLVMIDTTGESKWVLKMAVGGEAEAAIQRERTSLQSVSREPLTVSRQSEAKSHKLIANSFSLSAPSVCDVEPVCGHKAIMIERVQGRQLTPEEFEGAFLEDLRPSTLDVSNGVVIGEWLNSLDPNPSTQSLEPLVEACRECGALDLAAPLGFAHGDFAPWNVIQRTEVRSQKSAGRNKPITGSQIIDNNQSRYCAIDWEFSSKDTPLVFDMAYAAWCYSELLGQTVSSIDSSLWRQLVALGALWKELRGKLFASS